MSGCRRGRPRQPVYGVGDHIGTTDTAAQARVLGLAPRTARRLLPGLQASLPWDVASDGAAWRTATGYLPDVEQVTHVASLVAAATSAQAATRTAMQARGAARAAGPRDDAGRYVAAAATTATPTAATAPIATAAPCVDVPGLDAPDAPAIMSWTLPPRAT